MQISRKFKNFWHWLQAIAACVYFGFPGRKLTVIGVTGTDGKTTTTNLIYHILTMAGYKTAVLSTLSSAHTTTPASWKLQKFLSQSKKNNCTHVVLEVSSHAIDQNRVWGIPFAVGVLTNIADNEHLDYHKTFENYKNTKINFINLCKNKVIPDDKSLLSRINGQYVTFNLGKDKFPYETKLLGDFNKLNVLAAAEAAKILGVNLTVIKAAIKSFTSLPGRLEIVREKPFKVIVDFAHTPQAFEKVLPFVKKIGKRLIHVFGCTGERDKGKRPLMGKIASQHDDVIILTTEDTYNEDPNRIIEQILKGIVNYESRIKRGTLHVILDRREAIKRALNIARKDDVVIITGVGHQKSLNIKGKEVPWSDQKVVIEEMMVSKKAHGKR